MLNLSVKELRNEKYADAEKIAFDIADRVRESNTRLSPYNVFCICFLAYLAADNRIKETKSLMKSVEEMNIEEREFIEKNIDDLWYISIKLSSMYSKESLAAAVLWYTIPRDYSAGGEVETPESITKLANLVLAGKNELIADFCCGKGSFLLEAQNREDDSSYFGMEIDNTNREIAMIRMSMISDKTEIMQGSVFALDNDKKFDKIFCAYPWGCKKNDSWIMKEKMDALVDMIPELRNVAAADWFFIANTVYHLKDNGKAVVVVPNSIVVNGGVNKKIRKRFVDLGILEAVIALPGKLYSTTSTLTSLLVLSQGNENIRMIDASPMASSKKRQNELSNDAISEIILLMEKNDENSITVSPEQLKTCDYILSPSRYLNEEVKVENGVIFENVIKEMTRGVRLTTSELNELVSDIPTDIHYIRLSNIQDGIISGQPLFLKKLDKKFEKLCIKNNSLILAKNSLPVKVAVVSAEYGHKILANENFLIIELDEEKANPYYIKAYMESEKGTNAISQITAGAATPNISISSLGKINIPLPPKGQQDIIAEKYLEKMEKIKTLKIELDKAIKELKSIFIEG